jgi:hypothetical protein
VVRMGCLQRVADDLAVWLSLHEAAEAPGARDQAALMHVIQGEKAEEPSGTPPGVCPAPAPPPYPTPAPTMAPMPTPRTAR